MSTGPWQPGDPLFDQFSVHTPRWMAEVIAAPAAADLDAARWPRPFPRHDIVDDEEVIL